jgi:dienelactone hydrolase
MKRLPKAVQPANELWSLYRPEEAPLRFKAKDASQAKRWQTRTRRELGSLIGFQSTPKVDPSPRVLHTVDRGDHVREKLLVRVALESTAIVYLLTPKRAASFPLPTVLAFHGHGYGVRDIVGISKDGRDRNQPPPVGKGGYHKDFAVQLCRRGFFVVAPEISCFGERQSDYAHLTRQKSPVPTTCTQSAHLAAHLGGTVLGMRIRDSRRLVDWLKTRKEADLGRLGAMGISGGGMHTFFSAAMDTRIKACVVSGYFCTFRESILGMHHCACNFVPGLHRFGEMADIAGLIAPRPMLVEAGDQDRIFPVKAVRRAVRQARDVWDVFDARKEVKTDFFKGGHQVSGRKAYDFLWRHLVPRQH